MIAKAVKGKGFRGALDYDLGKEQGQMLDTNMAGSTPRELAAEFSEIRNLRPNLGKAVLHVSLSAAQGEKLSDDQWRDISQRYLSGMGFDQNQYVVTRHNDTDHEHIHIIANRIRFDGSVTSDSKDYKRQEIIMRQIERDYGLQQVAPSHEAERTAPTKGELECMLRSNEASTKLKLQTLCDAAAQDCHDYSTYQNRLEAAGVELIPVVQLQGTKMSGLSYRLDGVMMKGSDLGKAYSPAGLTKRGISYEQSRDGAAVSRSIDREKTRAFGQPDGHHQTSEATERGGISPTTGAISASDGHANGRNTPDTEGHQLREPAHQHHAHTTGRGIQSTGEHSHSTSRDQRQGIEAYDIETRTSTTLENDTDRGMFSTSRERILALSGGETLHQQHHRPAGTSGDTQARPDRSLEAIERQTQALGVSQFEIGIRDAKSGLMMNREWGRDELLRSTAWLKRMNAKGNDIYIRPAGEHGLVLVDDLKGEGLERIKRDLRPAALIETSPNNYQAWIKLSDSPIRAEVRAIVAKDLAQRYGGDLNSADSRHYGRLAGFTNQKPKHARDGRQPYVLAREWSGMTSDASKTGIEEAGSKFDMEMARKAVASRVSAIQGESSNHYSYDPVKEYRRQAKRLMERYGVTTDLSRMDYMIAKDMAKSGRFDSKSIYKAICEASPNIDTRKAGHIEDYAKRTVDKAVSEVELERGKDKGKERGFELSR